MTIHIAIIDQNETYRESLKTLLEQIEGFRVVLVSGDFNCSFNLLNNPVEALLIDNSICKQKSDELIVKDYSIRKSIIVLTLAMYKEELTLDYGYVNVILKNSGKKEFENRIRELVGS